MGSRGRTASRKRYEEKLRAQRAAGVNTARWILTDSRSSDKKCGRKNDLDREFIEAEIAKGCMYCGDSSSRMTLDRIDNVEGHVRTNVVAACIRCNLIRGDMPYSAWMEIAPAVRSAYEKGLFGQWEGRLNRNKRHR
jgi:hypothetical protein